ncbi:MAG: radical SAM protein, partial [Rectinemataceae bacterium]
PHAVVIATGCYAQMEPEALAALGDRVVVVKGEHKSILLSLAAWLSENWQGHGDLLLAVRQWQEEHEQHPPLQSSGGTVQPAPLADRFAFHPQRYAMHTRPALKIQDGCNHRCAYCRVCLARGPAISLPAEEVLRRVRTLEAAGKAEVVLTGVNLAQYRDGEIDFPRLVRLLVEGTSHIAFRISSYEPERIDEAFLAMFALERVRPHLHLSVQSGCTDTLRRMARPYDAPRVARAVQQLREARRDPFLAADIIAGFPGETSEEFETSLALLRELDFAWIHAFPFSPRPGTPAATMKPHVPERETHARVARLTALAKEGRARYIQRWLGSSVEMIIERSDGQEDGEEVTTASADDHSLQSSSPARSCITGTTANYLKVLVEVPASMPHESLKPGTVLHVHLDSPAAGSHADILGYL